MSRLSDLLAMSRKTETLAEKPQPKQGDQLSKGLTNKQSTVQKQELKMESQNPTFNNDTNMDNQIVTTVQPFDSDIKKEFSILDATTGQTGISRKGLARLAGVDPKAIRYLLGQLIQKEGGKETLPKLLQPFAGQGFEGGEQIPDVLASAIIKYYAYQGKEAAQETDSFLGAESNN